MEVYKRRLGGVNVTYTVTSLPMREKQCSDSGTPKKTLNASQVAAMYPHRLLKSVCKIIDQRREIGFTSPTGLEGTIELVSGLNAFIAEMAGTKATVAYLKQRTLRYLPEAPPSLIESLCSLQSTCVPTIPSPAEAGALIDLRREEWIAAGLPWGLHPCDASPAEVKNIQRDRKRGKDRMRAKEQRAASGARPQAESLAAFCRRNHISDRTFRFHRSKGPEALARWLASKGVTEALPGFVVPYSYNFIETRDETRQHHQPGPAKASPAKVSRANNGSAKARPPSRPILKTKHSLIENPLAGVHARLSAALRPMIDLNNRLTLLARRAACAGARENGGCRNVAP